jgi:hypothetical protein
VTDRKKPGVAFWATVAVVVVLIGYPLSFGPWIMAQEHFRQLDFFVPFYAPLHTAIASGPAVVIDPYIGYLELWSKRAPWFRLIRDDPGVLK